MRRLITRTLTLILAWGLLAACSTGQAVTNPPPTESPTIGSVSALIQPATLPPTARPTSTLLAVAAHSTAAPPPISPTPSPIPALRLAVLGDYGLAGQPEADVASLILGWQPDYILTTGDNNYPDGEQETIDENIGQYYHSYIAPYVGSYGQGGEVNRFFPTLGNHDWNTNQAQPYLDYFALPGNERYYDILLGPVHIFAVDSDSREPDGVSRISLQAVWLQDALSASTAPWKLVIMHHPPFSSGYHGPVDWMRWPFAEWGADAVLAGHDHTYERLLIDSIPYFVNGLGGGPIYAFVFIDEASQARYNDDHGAMLITADTQQITFQFMNRRGELIDSYSISK
ncbi:MAG: alkaline phosphatase [Chloroflexi bacterium]|nr:alkaline phosphatase [Chloroflexota bacterium]